MNTEKTPSLHLGPAVITKQPSPKTAAEPQGLVNTILRAKGMYVVRVVKDPVEMLRNQAEFLKAATSRGLVRVSKIATLDDVDVSKTALEARDDLLPGPSGERNRHGSGSDVYPPESAGSPFGPPPRGAENGIYGPGQPLSKDPNAPFNVRNGDNYDNSFARKYAAGLTEKQCLASGCTTRFSTGDSARLLCSVHAQAAGRLTKER